MRANKGPCKAARFVVASIASMLFLAASPVVAASSAQGGGADKPVSASHGDCKHHNTGVHNGYDCPSKPIGVFF